MMIDLNRPDIEAVDEVKALILEFVNAFKNYKKRMPSRSSAGTKQGGGGGCHALGGGALEMMGQAFLPLSGPATLPQLTHLHYARGAAASHDSHKRSGSSVAGVAGVATAAPCAVARLLAQGLSKAGMVRPRPSNAAERETMASEMQMEMERLKARAFRRAASGEETRRGPREKETRTLLIWVTLADKEDERRRKHSSLSIHPVTQKQDWEGS
jgi:hypothetical protein